MVCFSLVNIISQRNHPNILFPVIPTVQISHSSWNLSRVRYLQDIHHDPLIKEDIYVYTVLIWREDLIGCCFFLQLKWMTILKERPFHFRLVRKPRMLWTACLFPSVVSFCNHQVVVMLLYTESVRTNFSWVIGLKPSLGWWEEAGQDNVWKKGWMDGWCLLAPC